MYFINKGSYLVTFSLASCLIHLAESKRIGYLAESNIKRIGHLDESKWIGRLASEDDMINVGYGLNNGKYPPPPSPAFSMVASELASSTFAQDWGRAK